VVGFYQAKGTIHESLRNGRYICGLHFVCYPRAVARFAGCFNQFVFSHPGVPLRSTPGFMLSCASRTAVEARLIIGKHQFGEIGDAAKAYEGPCVFQLARLKSRDRPHFIQTR